MDGRAVLLLSLAIVGAFAALELAARMPAAPSPLRLAQGPPTPDPRPPPPPLPAGILADRVLIEKAAHRLTLYRDGKPLRSYDVALGTGGLAPKRREGDGLVPEGRYRITGHNPGSAYHYSLRISYPDARDIARAKAAGVPPGGDVMIHGLPNGQGWIGSRHRLKDWTAGCIAVTDGEIEEIAQAVKPGTAVEILP